MQPAGRACSLRKPADPATGPPRKSLGSLVYNAAAKDTRINPTAKINGTIDDSFTYVPEGDPKWLDADWLRRMQRIDHQ
jgi:hypothetical protein